MQTKMQSFVRSHPVVTLFFALIIGEVGTQFIPTGDSPWLMAAVRFVLAVIIITIIIIAASPAALKFDSKDIRYSLRKGLYVIILATLFSAASFLLDLMGAKEFVPNWASSLIGAIVLAIFVGIFEEGLFRVISIGAFLKLFGNDKKGVFWAILISSIIFGFVHNTGFLWSGAAIGLSEVIQMVLKTIQTGMLGFLLGAIYLKTKSIWGVALIHALNDLVLFVPGFLFGATGLRDYVQIGTSETIAIIGYLVFIVLYIPVIVSALKIMKEIELPAKGIFDEEE